VLVFPVETGVVTTLVPRFCRLGLLICVVMRLVLSLGLALPRH
jgi:hypothetical protein